jgi:2-succinyl-6-hydroxy-2,4-cyclohexadiene-1-carboxylate synthase
MQVLGLGSMPDYWDELEKLVIPVTVLAGALDEKFSAIAARIAAKNRAIRALTLPDVGHNPLLECPELIGKILAEALSGSDNE